MTTPLDDYNVQFTLPVVWGDMDSFRHVNNITYMRYFESVRMVYMDRINYSEWLEKHGIGPVLKTVTCNYKMPLLFPDTVTMGVKVTDLQSDRFTMHHIVFSEKHQKIAAEGESVLVYFNFEEGRKAPIPAEMLKIMRDIQPSLRTAGVSS